LNDYNVTKAKSTYFDTSYEKACNNTLHNSSPVARVLILIE